MILEELSEGRGKLAPGNDRRTHRGDPDGAGPNVWFQIVPERKTIKNRLHLSTSTPAAPQQGAARDAGANSTPRPAGSPELGATTVRLLYEEGIDHYAVAMSEPEGNEFGIN